MPGLRVSQRDRAFRYARVGPQVHLRPRVSPGNRVRWTHREEAVRAMRRTPGQRATLRVQRHGAGVRPDGFRQDAHHGNSVRAGRSNRGRDPESHEYTLRRHRGAHERRHGEPEGVVHRDPQGGHQGLARQQPERVHP